MAQKKQAPLHPHHAAALPTKKNGNIFAYLADSPSLAAGPLAIVVSTLTWSCPCEKSIAEP